MDVDPNPCFDFQCNQCGRRFPRKDQLGRHIRRSHPTEVVQCNYCTYSKPKSDACLVRRHQQTHMKYLQHIPAFSTAQPFRPANQLSYTPSRQPLRTVIPNQLSYTPVRQPLRTIIPKTPDFQTSTTEQLTRFLDESMVEFSDFLGVEPQTPSPMKKLKLAADHVSLPCTPPSAVRIPSNKLFKKYLQDLSPVSSVDDHLDLTDMDGPNTLSTPTSPSVSFPATTASSTVAPSAVNVPSSSTNATSTAIASPTVVPPAVSPSSSTIATSTAIVSSTVVPPAVSSSSSTVTTSTAIVSSDAVVSVAIVPAPSLVDISSVTAISSSAIASSTTITTSSASMIDDQPLDLSLSNKSFGTTVVNIPTKCQTVEIDCTVPRNDWKIITCNEDKKGYDFLCLDPRTFFAGAPSSYMNHPLSQTLQEKANLSRLQQKSRYMRQLTPVGVRTIIKEERCYLPDGTVYELRDTWVADSKEE